MSNYITSIIAFSFFALSEVLSLLPIPANGILHSLTIGIKNSLRTNLDNNVQVAQSLVQSSPEIPNIVSTIQGNYKLTDTIKLLNSKPQLIQYIEKIAYDKNLQFINTLLLNNPDLINDFKYLIVNRISKKLIPNQTSSLEPLLNQTSISMPEQNNLEQFNLS